MNRSRTMRKAVLFLVVFGSCPWANGQKESPGDPFGLIAFGFEEKFERRPLIKPSSEPTQSRPCGTGVYLREETVTLKDKSTKVKVVILYFLPNPSTAATFATEDFSRMKPALPRPPSNAPPGVSSLTFLWPPQLRRGQSVLFIRAEEVVGRLMERTMDFPAYLDVQEGDSPSILWKFDTFLPGIRSAELVGNSIDSDPVVLKISLPRGTKKCIEAK